MIAGIRVPSLTLSGFTLSGFSLRVTVMIVRILCVCGYSVIGPTFFRPFLAHFTSIFPRFFAVPSILLPRFQKPALRPRKTVRNGRETVEKRGSKTV